MVNAFSRSWQITKLTFSMIKADKKLLLFPLLASIFSILFVLALLFPTIFVPAMSSGEDVGSLVELGLLFLLYLGLAFISTFFNVCVVFSVKRKLEGAQASTGDVFGFAFSRIHMILLWSLVSATVGLLLRVIENFASRFGAIGQIVMKILVAMLGMVWSIITVFVVPVMVYHNMTPFNAIGHSVSVLKKTWGESLIRYYGLGIIQFIFMFIGIIIGVLLLIITSGQGVGVIIGVFVLMAVYLVVIFTLFSVANTVFNTLIFVYGDTGQVPQGVDASILQNAFKSSKKVSPSKPLDMSP